VVVANEVKQSYWIATGSALAMTLLCHYCSGRVYSI